MVYAQEWNKKDKVKSRRIHAIVLFWARFVKDSNLTSLEEITNNQCECNHGELCMLIG